MSNWSEHIDDNEQAFQLQKIIDMLVAAGYFRGRLTTLTNWDKVIGGILWAMTATGIPCDIHLNFKENQTIGEKISTAETIFNALKQMKCPYNIHSLRVQLLNLYVNTTFLNVIQWIVKCVIDYRHLTGNTVRNHSEFLFNVHLNNDNNNRLNIHCNNEGQKYLLTDINDAYQPQRTFAKENVAKYKTTEGYIDATLREYQFNFNIDAAITDITPAQNVDSTANKSSEFHEKIIKENDLKTAKTEMRHSNRLNEEIVCEAVRIVDDVGILVKVNDCGLNVEEYTCEGYIGMRNRKYSEIMYNQLLKRYKKMQEKKKERIEAWKGMKKKMDKLQNKMDNIVAENERYKIMIRELDAKLAMFNFEIVSELTKLVSENEIIKCKQKLFKEECDENERVFMKRLNVLNGMNVDCDLKDRLKKLESIYKRDLKNYDAVGGLLGVKNREYMILLRKLDAVSTRSELLQFERRFVELFGLTNRKIKEMKKYYNLYNSLKDNYDRLQNEVGILQTIESEFCDRSKTKDDREYFIKSMQKILDSLETNLGNDVKRLNVVKNEKDMKCMEYNELLNCQREYYKYVNEFENGCSINKELNDRIDAMERDNL